MNQKQQLEFDLKNTIEELQSINLDIFTLNPKIAELTERIANIKEELSKINETEEGGDGEL